MVKFLEQSWGWGWHWSWEEGLMTLCHQTGTFGETGGMDVMKY